MVDEANFNGHELLKILTSHEYTMTDDERLTKIDQIQLKLKEVDVIARPFTSEIHVLRIQRIKEKSGVDVSRLLYGIK